MIQCPGLGFSSSEAQAQHLARSPRPCQPHGMDDKEEKNTQNPKTTKQTNKKQTDRTPKQMVKAKLNKQNHTKKHTHTLTKEKKKRKRANKAINNPPMIISAKN